MRACERSGVAEVSKLGRVSVRRTEAAADRTGAPPPPPAGRHTLLAHAPLDHIYSQPPHLESTISISKVFYKSYVMSTAP
ncbi:hypothetical protein EVAR_2536_1 [Eumeta japonica]|uniref:Uncharacterized protein n=1 Tax=Eumeta variegata TaxID=151549 RepID=A0A4C1SR89_EUMVA|nr:hypothetical protein EVAR_2536_1 [Eumeta japonica]